MKQWKPHKKYTKYEISNDGKIKNSKTGRILKTSVNKQGYEQVCIHHNGKQYTKNIHRLIAETFYDYDKYDELEVNHIDGNKLNNRIENLEWCTRKENVDHAFRKHLRVPSRRIKIRVIETGEEYESIRECARTIGVDQSMICAYLNGKTKSCKGYHFERIE